jgi:hypothetical protein
VSSPPLGLFTTSRRLMLVGPQSDRRGGVVLRAYRPDGSIDREFGRGGSSVAAVGQKRRFVPVAAARQPNGRILVAGTAGGGPGGVLELLGFR